MNIDKTTEAFKEVIQACNSMGSSKDTSKAVADLIHSQHNTIEQNTIRFLSEVIQELAKKDYGIDGRNEDSIEWCKKVSEIPAHLPFI